eukprot:1047749-Prymnesium_polylepis.2
MAQRARAWHSGPEHGIAGQSMAQGVRAWHSGGAAAAATAGCDGEPRVSLESAHTARLVLVFREAEQVP